MRDKIQNDQFTTNFQQGDEFFAGDAWDAVDSVLAIEVTDFGLCCIY